MVPLFYFLPAVGLRLCETERVRLGNAIASESGVETLNLLAPLCKKLQVITQPYALWAKLRNSAPLNSPHREKNLLSRVLSSETSSLQDSPLSCPLLLLQLLCLEQILRVLVVFSIFVQKKGKEK